MSAILTNVQWVLSRLTPVALLDILIVTALFFSVFYLLRGTQALNLVRGVVALLILSALLSNVLRLTALNWVFRTALPALLVAIPVIFQPELRRALERLGRAGVLLGRPTPESHQTRVINAIVRAADRLSERRHGALIVLERETGLQDVADSGVPIRALVTPELLLTIFHPRTELHDGAVIVQEDRVVAAGCVLPLSENIAVMERHMGTRHRAALGITEQSDAIAIVVSEETGTISVAQSGRMVRNLDQRRLSRILHAFYRPAPLMTEGLPQWLMRTSR